MNVLSNVIGIYLTDVCNYKCVFCSVDNPSKKEESIEKENIFKILEENKDSDYQAVALWGGEPTTRKDFFEILEKIKECCYETVIIETNGSKFSDLEFLEKTLCNGVNYFIISIHGANAQVQDAISLVGGSFDRTIKAIENLKERGIAVRTNTVVNTLNYQQLPEIVEMLIQKNVDHINISALRTIGNAARNLKMVTPSFSAVSESVKKAFDLAIGAEKSISFDVFPSCTVKGYEEYQLKWTNFKMFYGDKVVNDFARFTNNLKSKGAVCKKCPQLKLCGGVFRGYVDLFGWSEFGY